MTARQGGDDGFGAGRDGRIQPVGQALRSTFDADNHETLGTDLTGLMIDLSRVPFDETEAIAVPPLPTATRRAAEPDGDVGSRDGGSGWLARIGRMLGRNGSPRSS